MPPASDSQRATIPPATGDPPRAPSSNSYRDLPLVITALLLALRLVNALTIRTFFQPDEFFQSLEPAWQLAFGRGADAWITWEWRTQLRSSLHPALFAAVYQLAARISTFCGASLSSRADLLLAAPKVAQALSAALLDGYTWKLAEKVYGRGSRTAWTALALSICSSWQWFCSARTLSNCLETTLTVIGVYHWPWHWPVQSEDGPARDQKTHRAIPAADALGSVTQLRLSLLLAAFACILRPTNALVWLSLFLPTFWQATNPQRYLLVREILFCGSAVLGCSVVSDRLYYKVWTFPPLRFLYFNIAQSLAVFYGRNRTDYYLTEGLPLLLTTALPFALIGLWRSVSAQPLRASPSPEKEPRVLTRLAWISLVMIAALSLISHKEVRFLYPILPFLHVLAAGPLSQFFPSQSTRARKLILTLLLVINVTIAGYASQVHQRGVIDVLSYLRHKHEAHNRLSMLVAGVGNETSKPHVTNTTVAFLMPCHSTPWRSHLIYPEIGAWALTCEPPLNVPLSERSAYLDEADQFYIQPGPAAWLNSNMEHVQTVTASGSRSGSHWARRDPKYKRDGRRAWPQNLVFFEQLQPVMKEVLGGSMYKECWRGFNSHFHDDGRRAGDVLVWCLDE